MRRFLIAYAEVAVEMLLGIVAVTILASALVGLGILALTVPFGWIAPAVLVFLAITMPSAISRANEKRRAEERNRR